MTIALRTAAPTRLAAVALVALVSLVSLVSPSASAGEAPKFGDLPVGRVTTAPAKKGPASVASSESVPGFIVASLKGRGENRLVLGDPKAVEALKRGEGFNGGDTSGGCFAESHVPAAMFDSEIKDDKLLEWQPNLSPHANVFPKSKQNPGGGVAAVHSERVVEQNGGAALETVDAWVDPASRGVRLIGKATLPLRLVGTAVGGMKVYAGRDERPDGRRFVQFVVTRPHERSQARMQRTANMWGMRQDGTAVHGNGCGHLRVMLPTDAKGGEGAVVLAPIILPSIASPDAKDDSGHDRAAKEVDAPKTASIAPDVKRALGVVGKGGKGGKGGGIVRPTNPIAPPPNMQEKELRLRNMQIQLSVSKTTRDKDPLVSVSFGWATREETQRVMEPDEQP